MVYKTILDINDKALKQQKKTETKENKEIDIWMLCCSIDQKKKKNNKQN